MGQEVVDHCFSAQDWYAIAVRVDVLSGGMTGGGKAFCHGKKYYTGVGSVLVMNPHLCHPESTSLASDHQCSAHL